MAKVDLKTVKENIKALNKKKLTDAIDISGNEKNLYALVDMYTDAIEVICDEHQQDKIPQKLGLYQNTLLDWLEKNKNKQNDKEETEEVTVAKTNFKKMSKKEANTWLKENDLDLKFKTKEWREDQKECIAKIEELMSGPAEADEELDEEAVRDRLEDMDFDEVADFCKENGITIEFDEDEFDEDEDECIDKVIEALKAGGGDDDEPTGDDFDEEAARDALEDMDDWKDVRAWLKEAGKKPKEVGVSKKLYEEDDDDCVDKIIEFFKGGDKKEEKTEEKSKKSGKTKEKEETPPPTVTPFRAKTMQDKFWMELQDGPAKVSELAVILNKGKKKDSDKKWNAVIHLLARKFGNKAPVTVQFEGTTVGEGVVSLVI